MKQTFALAAVAALSLAVAACGDDDDDDAAGGGTAAVTIADSGDTASEPVGSEPGDTGSPTGAGGTVGDITDAQAADCAAFGELSESLSDVEAPEVGEEISDEYKDEARSAIEQLEDLDLQTDEADAARDSLIDDINEVIDADEMTEELRSLGASDELIAFGQIGAAGVVAG